MIRQLRSDDKYKWNIIYIGRNYNSATNKTPSIESEFIPKLNVKFFPINSGKYDRKYFPNNFQELPNLIRGFFDAYKIVSRVKPNVIVSFGGYVSVPVIVSGWLKKIPSITHEQTLTNSLTTKINSLFVNKVALSFPTQTDSLPQKKIVITGNLLRSEIYDDSSAFFRNLKLDIRNLPLIYITAGNQGSNLINQNIKTILPQLKNFIIIHQTGKTDYNSCKKLSTKIPNYFVFDYVGLSDIGWIFKNADIIVSRSGANTCQEIVTLNKKSILIPLPKSQQNEQILNASWVQKKFPKETFIISQKDLNSKTILKAITKLEKVKVGKHNGDNQPNLRLLQLIHEII